MPAPALTPPPAAPAARPGRAVLRLVRPRQWVKNGYVLMPLVFSGAFAELGSVLAAAAATMAFTLCSAAVYCLNDVVDAPADRLHPRKRLRPVAAGQVPPRRALLLGLVLALSGAGLGAAVTPLTGLILLAYLAVNAAYCLSWKHVPLIDVMTVASGFLFRAVAGAAAVRVVPSPWLLTCTTFLSLLLVLIKRRQEAVRTAATGEPARAVVARYPLPLLDQLISGMVPATLLAYMLYAFTVRTPAFLLTSVFVAYGLFRYLYLVHTDQAGERPEEVLLADVPSLVNAALWAAVSAGFVWARL